MNIWKVLAEVQETLVVCADTPQDAKDIALQNARSALAVADLSLKEPVKVLPGETIENVSEDCLVYHERNGDLCLWEARKLSEEELQQRVAVENFRKRQLDMFPVRGSVDG